MTFDRYITGYDEALSKYTHEDVVDLAQSCLTYVSHTHTPEQRAVIESYFLVNYDKIGE